MTRTRIIVADCMAAIAGLGMAAAAAAEPFVPNATDTVKYSLLRGSK